LCYFFKQNKGLISARELGKPYFLTERNPRQRSPAGIRKKHRDRGFGMILGIEEGDQEGDSKTKKGLKTLFLQKCLIT